MMKWIIALSLFAMTSLHAQIVLQWDTGMCMIPNSFPNDIVVDASGNSYVCGWTGGLGYLSKTDAYGNIVWETTFDTAVVYQKFFAVMLGDSGDIYVTGACTNVNYNDMIICRYDTSGNLIWFRSYNGADNRDDAGNFIVRGINGEILVGGIVYTVATNTELAVYSYDQSGNQNWVYIYNGQPITTECVGIAVDGTGNIYAADWSGRIVSLDPLGNFRWSSVRSMSAEGFCTDANGNSYICGNASGNAVLTKFDSSGTQGWDSICIPVSSGYTRFFSVCVDEHSNVYVSGVMADRLSVKSFLTSGAQRWSYSGTTMQVAGWEVHARNGLVAVSGVKNYASSTLQGIMAVFDTTGIYYGIQYYFGLAQWAQNLVNDIDGSGNILVAGCRNFQSQVCTEIYVLKYALSSLGIVTATASLPPIYPNPASGLLSIPLLTGEPIDVVITNVSGKIVFTLDQCYAEVHTNLPPGLYIVRRTLLTGESITEKVVVQ